MKFKNKLLKIKGIGEKTVEDIISVYPTEEQLKLAIYNKENLPFDNDVEELLILKFKVTKKTKEIFKDYSEYR